MDAKWQSIMALDLQSVKDRLFSKQGWWWRLRHSADQLEKEYRQFLYLISTNPGQTVVPWSQELDDFWHEHILDTAKYARDCEAIWGRFIQHNPQAPKGTARHGKAYIATQRLYRAAFRKKASRRRSLSDCAAGCDASMPVAFCSSGVTDAPGHHGSHHHGGGHHDAGGHHSAGGHHGCAGHSGAGHGCGGHACGGHGCGGH
jgi:hypothetical protein